jgi:hypothetical protein
MEEIRQCFSFILLARQEVFLGTKLYLKALKLMRNFSFNSPHDVIDLSYNLAYLLAIAFSSDMMNDLVRVVLSPPAEAIAAS